MGSVAPQHQAAQKETKPTFPSEANTLEYAKEQDVKDPMNRFRDQFIIPSKANLKATKVEKPGMFLVPHYQNIYPATIMSQFSIIYLGKKIYTDMK